MDLSEIKARMADGRLYPPDAPELLAEQMAYCDALAVYNQLPPSHEEERCELLASLVAEMGEGCHIESPFWANWGGAHLHLGNRVYANIGLTLVDDVDIFVGDDVMFGPHVTLCTGTHPVSARLRAAGLQYNKSIHIERRVWIGAGAIVLPGVTIGEDSVIGAGSVVTHGIPAGVVAAGTPCRVLRPITEKDDQTYDHGKLVDPEFLI